MSFRLAALSAIALALPSVSQAAEYSFDAAHSSAGFKVAHMMVTSVRGAFGKLTGSVDYDEKNPTAMKIDAVIDAASIDTRIVDRDTHLKGPDFLDVTKHPNITFKSKKVESAEGGKLKVAGDLTIRGTTKPVVLDVEPIRSGKDPWGNMKLGTTATTKINRKDFGLTWNKGLETGGVLVGEDVEITLDIELAPKAPAKAAGK